MANANEKVSRFSGPIEASIRDIHNAYAEGSLSAQRLVQMYLDRIDAYDQQGPRLNAIITINSMALEEAASLDRAYAEGGPVGPLHGIPIIAKDNLNAEGMPTTGGCVALRHSIPADDAFVIKKLKQAGGIILAKSSMSVFAFGTEKTFNHILGFARNPYNTDYATGGSSGGTGAAVSANLGAVGLGTDTACSVRAPASICCLVGLRPTFGLVSCGGVMPMRVAWDVVGPMTRTVEDLAILLDAMVGFDPADANTRGSRGRIPDTYTKGLTESALHGMRLGVLRQMFPPDNADPEVIALTDQALRDLQNAGAEIVDPLDVPECLDREPVGCFLNCFKHDLNEYLSALGPDAPFRTLGDIVDSGKVHPDSLDMLRKFNASSCTSTNDPEIATKRAITERVTAWLGGAMRKHKLDAIVLPTFSYPPKKNEGDDGPVGCLTMHASIAGFPDITVPMGFTSAGLPMGLQFIGAPWSEVTLIKAGYGYEQATGHRKAPPTCPEL